AGRERGERQDMGNELMSRIEAGLQVLSYGEAAAYRRLAESLFLEAVDPLAILDHLIAIRHAVLSVRPGVALVIGEFARDSEEHFGVVGTRDGAVTILNNTVIGSVSLYGLPSGGQPFGLAML